MASLFCTVALIAQSSVGTVITDNLKTARNQVASVQLRDGRILIAGGLGMDQFQGDQKMQTLYKAEILDPATGRTSAVGNMNISRASHFLIPLSDGRVLVHGGFNIDNAKGGTYSPVLSSELFDPATGAFTLASAYDGFMSGVSDDCDVVALPEGFIEASYDGLYAIDFATGTQTCLAKYSYPRSLVRMIRLLDGRVLVAGSVNGQNPNMLEINQTLELYDPVTGRFELVQMPFSLPYRPEMALLPTGKVALVSGDSGLMRQVSLFDPTTKVVVQTATLQDYHFLPRLLLTTGDSGTHLAVMNGREDLAYPGFILSSSVELINMDGTYHRKLELSSPAIPRMRQGVARGMGKVWVFGGTDDRSIEAVPEKNL